MSFLPSRVKYEIGTRAATAAMSVGGERVQKSAFAQTVLAPVLLNHIPFYVTPYLGLRARLSQVWINRWTILLLLVLVRTLLAIVSIHQGIDSARKEALAACTGVEAAGSALASMPHYLAGGVNQMTANGVDKAVDGLMSVLTLLVTGVEELVVFVINMMTQTYLCLITLVITGSLHAAIALIEDATAFLNKTLPAIGDDIQSAVTDFEKTLNSAISGLDDVSSVFGGGSIPTLNLNTQIKALQNLQLPSNLDSDLNTLNSSIPTFAQVNNITQTAIRWPFEQLKDLIANHTGNYTFDDNELPVPAKQSLSFCSTNSPINDFFNGLIDLLYEARKISVAVLVILAVLVIIPMAYLEIRRNRAMEANAKAFEEGEHEMMDAEYLTSRPFTASAGLKVARALPFKASRKQALIRWAIAYATTIPALFVLSLGIAGLFSCLTRYLILVSITKEVPDLVQEVDHFADQVLYSLNNASTYWATETNYHLDTLNARINNDVFGWVNISTHAVNDTLNTFVDETIKVLNFTFGGTILYDPVTELFNCLIGLKIDKIEEGLTWVSDHAYVDMPSLPNNTFSLGAASSIANGTSASTLLSTSSSTGSPDAITEAVDLLISHIESSIRTEALISTGVVAIWVVVALIGIFRALWLFWRDGDVRNEGDRTADSTPSFVCAEGFGRELDEKKKKNQPGPVIVEETHTTDTWLAEKTPPLPNVIEKPRPSNPFADPRSTSTPPAPQSQVRQPPQNFSSDLRVPIPMPPPAVRIQPPSRTSSPAKPPAAPTTAINPQNNGNTYNSVPYTLNPRPFPRFADPVSPISPSDQVQNDPFASAQDSHAATAAASIRFAGQRNVGGAMVKRPGHVRQSSHGDVGHGVSSRGENVGGGGPSFGNRRADGNVTFESLGH